MRNEHHTHIQYSIMHVQRILMHALCMYMHMYAACTSAHIHYQGFKR